MTGATYGFGLEMVKELARQGARLILMTRSAQVGQAMLENMRAQAPDASIEITEADMSNSQSVRAFAVKIKAGQPPIDALINNAGVVLNEKHSGAD